MNRTDSNSNLSRPWQVLLIGGTSGIGKSYLARQLADHYKVPLMELDDIRIALHQLVDRAQYPELFALIDSPNFHNELSNNEFVTKLLAVGEVVWKSVDTLISKHIFLNETVIMEGDAIIPNLLARREQDKIKVLFLYDSPEVIKERQSKRNRSGKEEGILDKNVEFSHAYSEEIIRQANEHGFKTLHTTPAETLLERAIACIED